MSDLEDVLLVLWPGAGGDADQRHMVALAKAVEERGGRALREPLTDRQMPKLIASARRRIAELRREHAPKRLILGGRSMGGRMTSMLVAEGEVADGLVFLSYPLHPPEQEDKLRDRHLYGIETPMLFVGGDRDEFAEISRLRSVIAKLGDRATLELWPGADHSMRKVQTEDVNARVLAWILRTLRLG
jgi:uncharacterized protein